MTKQDISLSFEFFAPRGALGQERLRETYRLIRLPCTSFVSLTLHAGGSAEADVLGDEHNWALSLFASESPPRAIAHVSCAGKTMAKVEEWLDAWWDQGVRGFVALRGDNPGQARGFKPHLQGFDSSLELITRIRQRFGAEATIYVAAYPEVHPDARDSEAGLDFLKRKFDAGANAAISQFFFDPDIFLRFRDQASRAGIDAPIMPGILPVHAFAKVDKFASQCGATIPDSLRKAFEGCAHDKVASEQLAVRQCADTCTALIAGGVDHLHFYTLNLSNHIPEVLRQQGFLKSRKANCELPGNAVSIS